MLAHLRLDESQEKMYLDFGDWFKCSLRPICLLVPSFILFSIDRSGEWLLFDIGYPLLRMIYCFLSSSPSRAATAGATGSGAMIQYYENLVFSSSNGDSVQVPSRLSNEPVAYDMNFDTYLMTLQFNLQSK